MYADDITLFNKKYDFSSFESAIGDDLDTLNNWFSSYTSIEPLSY